MLRPDKNAPLPLLDGRLSIFDFRLIHGLYKFRNLST